MMNTCSADVLRSWYNLAAAARYTRMLLDYSREHGLTHWSEPGSRLQAILDSKGGDLDAQDCGGCTPALTRSPSITPAVGLLGERVEAFVRVGRIAEALAVIKSGFGQSEGGWIAPELLRLRGELLLSQGVPVAAATAEKLFGQALNEASRQGALAWELRSQRASPAYCVIKAVKPQPSPACSRFTTVSRKVSTLRT